MTGLRLGSRLWWGLPTLLVLLWGAGALSSFVVPGIPATPLSTLVAAPVVAYAQELCLALAIGCVVTLLWSNTSPVRGWAMGWAVAAVMLSLASAAALQSDVTALPLGTDTSGLLGLLSKTAVGQAMVVQFIALLSAVPLIGISGVVGRTWPIWCALSMMALSVAAPAVAGHAGLSSEHQVAGVSTGLHAIAISLWVGGLAAVSARCVRQPAEAPVLLPRFSTLALICVIVAGETGLLSASLTVGNLNDLMGSTYGSVIIGKAVVLAWLIRFGWLQRRRAMDLLPDVSVPKIVARMAGFEFLLMGSAIAGSVVLVRIGPPAVPMSSFAPLTLLALAVGAGMLLASCFPRGARLANAWPEATMVLLLVVLVEVGGVGLLRTFLGVIGLAVEIGIVMVVGWLAMTSMRQSILVGSLGTTILALVGVPAALALNAVIGAEVSWRMSVVVGMLGEVLLVTWWRRSRRCQPQPTVDAMEVAA